MLKLRPQLLASAARSRNVGPPRPKGCRAGARDGPRHVCRFHRASEPQRPSLRGAKPERCLAHSLARPGTRHSRHPPRRAREPRAPSSPSDLGPAVAASRNPTHLRSAAASVARGAAAQPRQAVLVAFADLVRSERRDFRSWRRRGRTHGLAHSFRVRGRVIQDLRRSGRGSRVSGGDFRPSRDWIAPMALPAALASVDAPLETSGAAGAGAFPVGSSLSTSALAD